MKVYVLFTDHAAIIEIFSTEGRAKAHAEILRRNGVRSFIVERTVNQIKDKGYEP